MLAHQGGWDEILLIVGPVLVVIGLLRLAKKRVDKVHQTPVDPPGADGASVDE